MRRRQGLRAGLMAGLLSTILIIIIMTDASGSASGGMDDLEVNDLEVNDLEVNDLEVNDLEVNDLLVDLSFLNYTIDENLRHLSSSEALLEAQSRQLESLEENDTIGLMATTERIKSLDNYEKRLRDRAVRLARIEAELEREWPALTVTERVSKTKNLEYQLRSQALHLYSFQSHLKKSYCRLSASDKRKFLLSFEDLLDRETELLSGFEAFAHRLQDAENKDQIDLLASFEDLIRRQAVLLDTYHDLLNTRCEGLKLEKYVKRCGKFRCGQNITYYFVLESTSNYTIEEVRILDDRLGYIAQGVSLRPKEKKVFEKSTTLNYPSGKRVCNTAYAFGLDSDGLILSSASDRVCIKIAEPVLDQNIDSINLGDQKTIAIASDPAIAENSIIIKKNQNKEGLSNNDAINQDSINAGDQLAGAYHNSRASNRIKIVSDQE